MHKKKIFIIGLLVLVLLSSNLVKAESNIKNQINNYLSTYTEIGTFSGSVLIAKEGKVIFHKGYGKADLELNVDNTRQNKFRIGSLTKQFTAAAILQLEEKRMLNIKDSIDNYIEDYPYGEKIKIKNLLNHTSGIYDYTRTKEFRDMMGKRTKLEKVIELFKDKELNYQPGEKYQYCNSNYVLLGYIIEKVSGLNYGQYLRENIFAPLNMENTGFAYHHIIIEGRASGYVMNPDGSKMNMYHDDATFAHGAGALYSTTADLYKWDRALYTNKILSENSLSKMLQVYKGNYGFGFKIDELFGHKRYYHHGGTMGYTGSIIRYINDNTTIIVLTNINGTPIEKITRDLSAILFNKNYYLPKVKYHIGRNEFEKYKGSYKLTSGREVRIISDQGKYFAKMKRGPAFEIIPSGKHQFLLKVMGDKLEFTDQKNGKFQQLKIEHVYSNESGMRI